jgi:CRP-like cAMP-binding protein
MGNSMEELYRYFDQFYLLNQASRDALEKTCSEVLLPKNELLQPFGHTCKTIYYIKSGIARIFYYKDGTDITEYFAFENNIVARVESLFTGQPSKKAIQMLEDSHLIAIHVPGLYQLYDTFPQIERLFRLIFEAGYVETVNRMESLQFHTAEERYLDLLKKPNIIQRIPLKHIASYLGITQVSLSRIRSTLK